MLKAFGKMVKSSKSNCAGSNRKSDLNASLAPGPTNGCKKAFACQNCQELFPSGVSSCVERPDLGFYDDSISTPGSELRFPAFRQESPRCSRLLISINRALHRELPVFGLFWVSVSARLVSRPRNRTATIFLGECHCCK